MLLGRAPQKAVLVTCVAPEADLEQGSECRWFILEMILRHLLGKWKSRRKKEVRRANKGCITEPVLLWTTVV